MSMGQTMPNPESALERLNHAGPSGRSAKAHLQPHTAAYDMREAARHALKRTGKQESNGAGLSQSRLSHKFSDGTLTIAQMEALGGEFLAKLGEELVERYAPLHTPAARLRALAKRQRDTADEMDQLAQFIEVA